jgi:Tol biopolymer transport system component
MRRLAAAGCLAVVVAIGLSLATRAQERGDPCAADARKFCKGVRFGGGRLIRCLAEHETEITPACRERIVRLGGLPKVGGRDQTASAPRTPTAQPSLRVRRVTTVRERGGRVDWSAANGKIAYDSPDQNGYFQIHVMDADGNNDQCLTCNKSGIPQKHNGNPAWDPSGRYIVFQSEKQQVSDKLDTQSTPGSGTFNDLWIITRDGSRFWKVRDLPYRLSRNAPGTLHPHFSHDGKRLLWSERVGAGSGAFGEWVLHIGNVHWGDQVTMDNVQSLTPGEWPCFYESHGWSKDDSRILFSGNLLRGQPAIGLDIFEMSLATRKLTRLTNTLNEWDEHAQYSPDGRRIVWISNTGLPLKLKPFQLRTEYWIMDADGGNKFQLTHFNTPGSPEHRGKPFITAGDSTWSPDGMRLLALLIDADPASKEHDRGSNVMIELAGAP